MAGNYVQEGDVINLTAPVGGVVTGTGYLIGTLFVVALVTAAAGESFAASVEGVFILPKTSAQAWTEGQKVFWDNTNHRADSDATVGQLIGVAVAVAANPTATGAVRLNCGVPALAEGAQAAIADIATADATDLASAEALANAIKAKFNTLLAELRIVGIIAP